MREKILTIMEKNSRIDLADPGRSPGRERDRGGQ